MSDRLIKTGEVRSNPEKNSGSDLLGFAKVLREKARALQEGIDGTNREPRSPLGLTLELPRIVSTSIASTGLLLTGTVVEVAARTRAILTETKNN